MSKPSRRPNRENRPKKKRDRELKRAIDAIPIVVGFYDQEGNEIELSLDCERCWARLSGEEDSQTRRSWPWRGAGSVSWPVAREDSAGTGGRREAAFRG